MSINEVLAWQATRDAKSKGAAGLGKYGFMPDTIRGLADKYKIDKTKLFDGPMQEHFQNLILEENLAVMKKGGVASTPGNLYMAQYVGAGGATWVHEAIRRGEGDISVVEAVARGWMRNKQRQGKNPTEEDKQKYIQGVLKHNKELGNIRADQFESVLGNRLAKKSGNATLAGGAGPAGGTGPAPTPTPSSPPTTTVASGTPSTSAPSPTSAPSQSGSVLAAATTSVASARDQIQMSPPMVINAPVNNVSPPRKDQGSPSIPIPSVVDEDFMKILVERAIA